MTTPDKPKLHPPGPNHPDQHPATQADVRLILDAITTLGRALSREHKKLEKIMSATQADVDAVLAALQAEDSTLNTAVASLTAADAAISAQLAALAAANPAIDISGLQAELANSQAASAAVAAAVSATAALVPAAPAPPAA